MISLVATIPNRNTYTVYDNRFNFDHSFFLCCCCLLFPMLTLYLSAIPGQYLELNFYFCCDLMCHNSKNYKKRVSQCQRLDFFCKIIFFINRLASTSWGVGVLSSKTCPSAHPGKPRVVHPQQPHPS